MSGIYVCIRAQNAIPSFQELEKLVISTSTYPPVFDWHHLSSAFRLDPPFLTREASGSAARPSVEDGESNTRIGRGALLIERIETGDSASERRGEETPATAGSLFGVGEDGANTGLAGFSEIGDRVGMAGVEELRE